jgi:hypothetical protein
LKSSTYSPLCRDHVVFAPRFHVHGIEKTGEK